MPDKVGRGGAWGRGGAEGERERLQERLCGGEENLEGGRLPEQKQEKKMSAGWCMASAAPVHAAKRKEYKNK